MALLGVYFRVEYLTEVFPSLWCFHMTKPALTAYAFYPPLVLLTMKNSISSGPEPLLPACYLLSSSQVNATGCNADKYVASFRMLDFHVALRNIWKRCA